MEPTWYMNLEPRASAMEPESRRTQPQVRAWMEDGLCFVSTDEAITFCRDNNTIVEGYQEYRDRPP
jgi:hypothetical protein